VPNGAPRSLKPALMPRRANQPCFISSARRTGCAEQCDCSDSGAMSARLTIVPSSARNAIVIGTSVFFIQKQRTPGASLTNSMPSLPGMSRRPIMPVACCAGVAATSALTRYMPAVMSTVGSLG